MLFSGIAEPVGDGSARGLFLTRKFALQLIGDLLGDCALNGLGQRRSCCGGRLRQCR